MSAVGSVTAAALLGCSGGEEPSAAPETTVGNAASPRVANLAPVIDSVRLSPNGVAPGELLSVSVKAHDPEGDEVKLGYSWQFGGYRFPGGESSIEVPTTAKRDDLVRVSVTASDGRTTSDAAYATAEVKNTAPEWRELSLERPNRVVPGSLLTIVAVADDHDGDDVRFEIQWYVNNRLHENQGNVFDTSELHRGNIVFAVVLAADKTLATPERETDKIVIGNADPTIVSAPGALSKDGSFDYQVEVSDPDGDRRFRFALASAPSGMEIDSAFGQIRWKATEDHAGTHPVEIVATDLHGGEARQKFELTVSVRTEESGKSAPAAPDENN